MQKQCAGCGKVFEVDGPDVTPRPYGCCEECNASTFRTNADKEVLPPPPAGSGLVPPEVPQAPEETIEVEQSAVDNTRAALR